MDGSSSTPCGPEERIGPQVGIIERAFELARSGEYENLQQITAQLRLEQYGSIEQHLAGMLIRKQLRRLMESGSPVSSGSAASRTDSRASRDGQLPFA